MVRELLAVPDIDLEGEKLAFDEAPGGAYVHHAYEGGLLQHTLAVANLALTMCDDVVSIPMLLWRGGGSGPRLWGRGWII
jgi:23S rRNA maturation-related 3'-5' exoribonuclease YhaM